MKKVEEAGAENTPWQGGQSPAHILDSDTADTKAVGLRNCTERVCTQPCAPGPKLGGLNNLKLLPGTNESSPLEKILPG